MKVLLPLFIAIWYLNGILGSYVHPSLPVLGKHPCPQYCKISCKYGRVIDKYGCTLCKCRKGQRRSCRLPKKVGPCKAAIPRYFFNTATGKCESFSWGGCQPNANNFETKQTCFDTCGQPGVCGLPRKVGPCRAAIPRYYFNAVKGKCESFSWGGCQPNGNNFKTLEECADTCVLCRKRKCKRRCPLGYKRDRRGCQTCRCNLKPSENSGCNVRRDKGLCGKRQLRYFYNQKTGKCQKFYWGGCNKNSNNFKTLQECRGACVCGPVCLIFCPKGNVLDDRGCPTCQCRP